MNRRFLFVQLPFLPTERFIKAQRRLSNRPKPFWEEQDRAENEDGAEPQGPLVLVTHGAKGTRISALGADAVREGLWVDMKLNDARAMMPDVRVENHDVIADRLLHHKLARWMVRYTPRVALWGTDGFMLDVAGCTHLFGDEAAMGADIERRFEKMGLSARLAFADTVGAACALVSYGAVGTFCPEPDCTLPPHLTSPHKGERGHHHLECHHVSEPGSEAQEGKQYESPPSHLWGGVRGGGETAPATQKKAYRRLENVYILPENHDPAALDSLPVEALRLDEETLILLKRLGLKLIGDVRRVPRTALERRFRDLKKSEAKRKITGLARSVQWRLDQLSGALSEPLDFISEPQSFRALKQCPALALETGAVEIALEQLLPDLCAQLEKASMGARRFELFGYRADGGVTSVPVSLSAPSHAPKIIQRLFKDRLDRIDCGFGIDLFVLQAVQTEILSPAQTDMTGHGGCTNSASLARFADTLANRFADAKIGRLAPRTSHVPERAQVFAAANEAIDWARWAELQPQWAPRPVRLLTNPEPALVTAELPDSPPVQFIWRKRLHKVVRARGPERVLPEWWHDNLKAKRSATFRDYYDVEDHDGMRFWLFRSIKDEPVEDGEEGQTIRSIHWFVHGLF